MKKRAEIVIIGGGVIGTACAYHLARAGHKDVILLEMRDALGAGATTKSAGGIRHQFSTEINIKLSIESIKMYEVFDEVMEAHIEFKQYGYLFCASDDKSWQMIQRNVKIQNHYGIPVDLLTPKEAQKIVPNLFIDDLLGASFYGRDGYADTAGVVNAFAKKAEAMGAGIETQTEVTDILTKNGAISGVETSQGQIDCSHLILAAGPHTVLLGQKLGLDIPIRPYRRNIFITHPFPKIPENIPLTIDLPTGWYMRKETGCILMGMSNKKEPTGFNETVDWDWFEKVAEAGIHRVPDLAETGIFKAWAGVYDETPDHHAIVGPVQKIPGLILACGFSGHGFQHGAITGKIVSEIIDHGKGMTVDVTPLRFERFEEGQLVDEVAVI